MRFTLKWLLGLSWLKASISVSAENARLGFTVQATAEPSTFDALG